MNGKNSQGKQKYKCKKCGYCFVRKSRKKDDIKGGSIFNDWVTEGYSSRQLGIQKSKDKRKVIKMIREKLDNNFITQIDTVYENVKYIMIDGIWVTKEICLIIYYDYINKKVLYFRFCDGEKYEYIKDDLLILKNSFKYDIVAFVVDGAKQIKKAIQEVYFTAKIQRCLTHIQRQVKNYISNHPKSDCGKELQRIIVFENFKDRENFTTIFNAWNEKWSDFLKEKSFKGGKFWYTHRKLRGAKSHIKNALPNMFHYREDENIKKSSNDLEGYNGVLSDQIYNHRGLRIDRLISFISLWIYERNL